MTIVASGVLLLVLNRNNWFLLDEWNFLVDRRLVGGSMERGIWDPHNEHWSTAPVLVYRGLLHVFGLGSYLPYVSLAIGSHLVAGHLLWRVVRRVAGDPWVATAGATVFLFFGSGWENLLRAFQFTLTAPLAIGLAWLLVQPQEGPFARRDALGWALGMAALMLSGVGVTMVGIAALRALFKRGIKVAALTASVPALAYATWFITYGSSAQSVGTSAGAIARDLPRYVLRGLTGTFDALTGVTIGAVAVALLGGWALLRARPADPRWSVALACALGAVAQITLAGVRRVGLGVEQATASRYLYMTFALLLPLLALAVASITPRSRRRLLVGVVAAGSVIIQFPRLYDAANEWSDRAADQRRQFVAAVILARSEETLLRSAPYPQYSPDVDVHDLLELADDGLLPTAPRPTTIDWLSTRTALQLRATFPGDLPPAPPAIDVVEVSGVNISREDDRPCVQLAPQAPDPVVRLRPTGQGVVWLASETAGEVRARYAATSTNDVARDALTIPLPAGERRGVETSAVGVDIVLELPFARIELCGIARVTA